MTDQDDKIVRATRLLVKIAASVAGVTLLVLMLLTTADVAGRYFLNQPITGVFDITHFAVLVMVFLGLAYCEFENGHVAIDLFYNRLGPAAARILSRITSLLGAIFCGLIAWRTMVQSVDVKAFNEASQLVLIPFYPFYYVLAFGAALYALVMILRIFRPLPESHNLPAGD